MTKNPTKVNEMTLHSDGKYYPNDHKLRASRIDGHSGNCPIPTEQIQTFTFKRNLVDIEVRKGSESYCWDTCTIGDCPAYIAERGSK